MKRFFIWKDGKYNGENTEWQEISGEEFYELVNDPANSDRLFIHHNDVYDNEADEVYFEATEENYKRWDRMRKKEEYDLQIKLENPIEVVSLDTVLYYDDNGIPVTLADEIPEPDPDPMIVALYEVIDKLLPEEREMITRYYLDNPQKKSQRVIAEEMGMPQQTFSYRLKKILEKMKRLFGEN